MIALRDVPKNSINKNDILILNNNIILNNVGNRRFQVVLGIFRKKYMEAIQRGNKDETVNIVANIVDSICHKAIPNGHFIEFDSASQAWYDIGDGELACQIVVMSLLENCSTNKVNATTSSSTTTTSKLKMKSKKEYTNKDKCKEKVNLFDTRFEVKDSILVDNLNTLKKRKITAKIRRNQNKRAVRKEDCLPIINITNTREKKTKRIIRRASVIKSMDGVQEQKQLYENNESTNHINKTEHRNLNTSLLKKTSPTRLSSEVDDSIHDEIAEILSENKSMTFDYQHLFSDDE